MRSAKETQEAISTESEHCLESKAILEMSVIFLINWGIPSTLRQT